ncbi:MAG: condensation domain-containing protein, partial [Stellaceae bacterium]
MGLTSAQTPVWLDLETGANPSSYIIGGYIWIPGAIDIPQFARAVAIVIERNDALRLRFEGQHALQRLDTPAEPPVDAIDLRGRPDAETAFRQFLESEFPKPFDLSSRSPL